MTLIPHPCRLCGRHHALATLHSVEGLQNTAQHLRETLAEVEDALAGFADGNDHPGGPRVSDPAWRHPLVAAKPPEAPAREPKSPDYPAGSWRWGLRR